MRIRSFLGSLVVVFAVVSGCVGNDPDIVAGPPQLDGGGPGTPTDAEADATATSVDSSIAVDANADAADAAASADADAEAAAPQAHCSDSEKNAGETGIDCGGATTCPRCPLGDTCLVNSDCASNSCDGTTCKNE